MIETLVLLLLLLAVSAFFSGSEIAFFSVTQARARALAQEGRRGARALLELKGNPERLLVTILIGNNVANIAAASVATYTATEAFGSAGIGIATGVMTLLVLFFGEITPKSFAAAHSVTLALLAAPLVQGMSRILFFLVKPIEALTRKMVPRRAGGPTITEREIRIMARMGHTAGVIEEHERRLIERVFTLDRTRAWEAMTPRVEIYALQDSLRLADVADELARAPYSRVPVFGESLDDVTGVLYVRDAYQALISGQRDVTLRELAREPLFVPSSLTLVRLLEDFQARRVHLGLVVDEYGGIDGLITLEDILEELVGEIVDETDVREEPIVRLSRSEILVTGGAELREINHFFNTSFPILEHRSLNGYLLDALGRVPQPGETIEREGVRIEVMAATGAQVTRARLSRLPTAVRRPEGERPAFDAGRVATEAGGRAREAERPAPAAERRAPEAERGSPAAGRPAEGEPKRPQDADGRGQREAAQAERRERPS